MDVSSTIKAIVILDSDGLRLLSKPFDPMTDSKKFERKLFTKTKSLRTKDEIIILEGYLVIHRFITDIHIYIVGGKSENPVILDSLMNCLTDSLKMLLSKHGVERQTLIDHLTKVILALDEISDRGTILEMDPNMIFERVCAKDDIADQTMAQKIQHATEHIKFPWIRS